MLLKSRVRIRSLDSVAVYVLCIVRNVSLWVHCHKPIIFVPLHVVTLLGHGHNSVVMLHGSCTKLHYYQDFSKRQNEGLKLLTYTVI